MTKPIKPNRKRDREYPPALPDELAMARGGLTAAAEEIPIPPRFDCIEDANSPAMIITDETTRRSTLVPLYAYRSVREALRDLFGE
jgi:hypothetical protein